MINSLTGIGVLSQNSGSSITPIGVEWRKRNNDLTVSSGAGYFHRIAWCNDRYILTIRNASEFYYSYNGIDWFSNPLPFQLTMPYPYYYNGNYFIYGGDVNTNTRIKVLYSSDGITWIDRYPSGIAVYRNGTFTNIVEFDDKLVSTSSNSGRIFISDNALVGGIGFNWREVQSTNMSYVAGAVMAKNGVYTIIPVNATTSSTTTYANYSNLSAWYRGTVIGSTMSNMKNIAKGIDNYVCFGNTVFTTIDGTSFSNTNFVSNSRNDGGVFCEDKYVCCSINGYLSYSEDGNVWTSTSELIGQTLTCCYGTPGVVFISSDSSLSVARIHTSLYSDF